MEKRFAIPVSWTVTSMITVKAETEEEAQRKIEEVFDELPLPKDNVYYLSDSFQCDFSEINRAERFPALSLSEIEVD